MGKIYNSGWIRAREEAAEAYAWENKEPVAWGFANLRVHDLKHTFGRRLRAAGVPLETRKVLLGHRNGDITSHYSAPEIEETKAMKRVGIGVVPGNIGDARQCGSRDASFPADITHRDALAFTERLFVQQLFKQDPDHLTKYKATEVDL